MNQDAAIRDKMGAVYHAWLRKVLNWQTGELPAVVIQSFPHANRWL